MAAFEISRVVSENDFPMAALMLAGSMPGWSAGRETASCWEIGSLQPLHPEETERTTVNCEISLHLRRPWDRSECGQHSHHLRHPELERRAIDGSSWPY